MALGYKKEISNYTLQAGLANIPLSFGLIYLYGSIGAMIALVVSELLLLLMIVRKLNMIEKR